METLSQTRQGDNASHSNVEPEVTHWSGGFSFRSLIGIFLGAAVLTTVLLGLVFRVETFQNPRVVWVTLPIILGAVWGSLILFGIYRKLGNHYEVTSYQLKHRSGVLVRQSDRVEMIDIDDVMYKQGPLQAIFNVGTICLTSSDSSHPKLFLNGIKDVGRVANLIESCRRAERVKRGLHVESI